MFVKGTFVPFYIFLVLALNKCYNEKVMLYNIWAAF
ncbi:hypothetical protein Tmath_0176 [Thermoanaerobacter mathranii subsp. mathranii str. A3]|jgi:hypothetical protein|uniref:Uncharacterized protein n=2 Tax=Thermoanaerobacter TaxID=1754 RepID=D3T5E6_THEIA|nr:hypothetical protein Thit_0119 [Thermoanaerobacter italicus Ab9]ADH59960.1 hypothetical protein Tmath_0176 [Thermoanaerobacter mathranii subsp. mathranii str. A3]MDK2815192.1 hypothetical protein [Thermoanaerobacter sp.]